MLATQAFPNGINLKGSFQLLWIDMNGWYIYSGTPLLQTPLLTDILLGYRLHSS